MKITAALLSLALTLPGALSIRADAVQDVRMAETNFAKAFADRDKTKFFTFVADDAVFMSALGTLRGKQKIVERWSRFFDNVPVAPFSWGPERVEVTADGKIGFSMGPIYDPEGKHAGYYSSIWAKQADGSWKVVLDGGPGNPPAPLPENNVPSEEGTVTTPDGEKLFYRKIGASPIVMIVPLDFALHDAFRQFADIATVITYDPRNRAKSSRMQDVAKATIDDDVRDMEAVRAQLKVEKIIPVGISYLGKVVAMYAAAHPEHVSRVIQIGPAANHLDQMPPIREEDWGTPKADLDALQKLRAETQDPHKLCTAFWKVMSYRMVGDPKHASRFDLVGPCATENEVLFAETFRTMWPTIEKSSLSDEELKKITMPVLTIHGTKDRNAQYEGGMKWVASLPDARLITVNGAAHASWLDDPVTVFGSIRHFIRGEWPLISEQVK
jgi:pimeloyl-ACP methyl ester carboxylesterase